MSTFKQVFLTTVEPTEESGEGVGMLNWDEDEGIMQDRYRLEVKDYGDNNTVALWNSYVPYEWTNAEVTEYLEETFFGDTPDGYPIQVHNEPFPNYPHKSEFDQDAEINNIVDGIIVDTYGSYETFDSEWDKRNIITENIHDLMVRSFIIGATTGMPEDGNA